jgi:biopolymer transport protein ExbD
MKIARPRRRMVIVPTASFGDIAFLLIIFFMVASVFMKESNIKVKPADSPDIDKVKNLPVSIIMDSDGKIWLQGDEYAKDALESEVTALLRDKTDKQVMLKVDRKLQQKDFGVVLKALSNAGAEITLVGEKKGR